MSSEKLLGRLRELGSEVQHQQAAGLGAALDRATEEADTATDLVDRIAYWIGPAERTSPEPSVAWTRTVAELRWRDATVSEEFVRLGASGLVGVLTRPASEPLATVVFLNSGSEAHVGPGRAWVELARTLALAGLQVLRVDFRGWGESPDDGFAPGRPYAPTHLGRCRGADRHVTPSRPAAGVPGWRMCRCLDRAQAGDGHPGGRRGRHQSSAFTGNRVDPVEALLSDTRSRRMPEIEYFNRHGAELERTPPQHPAGAWLDELREAPVPTLVISSEGDDGVEFLESRLPSTWGQALASEVFRLATIDIDHALHEYWQRDELVAPIVNFVAAPLPQKPLEQADLTGNCAGSFWGR